MNQASTPDPDDRSSAIAFYNRAQQLYHVDRTPEQDQEMLDASLTSRSHWQVVGGPQQFAMADWMVSRAYVQLNDPVLAIEYALVSLSHNQKEFPAWLKASIYEGLARAYRSAGNTPEFERYKGLAIDALSLETDPEDKGFIAGQIAGLSA